MVQGQVFLKGGGCHFSYLIFLRFIIFTFRNYFTKSPSAARQPTSANISSRRLVPPAADDDFVKLVYSLKNCVMHLKKSFFFLPP